MIPIHDKSAPSLKAPHIIWVIIGINVFAHIFIRGNEDLVHSLGVIPSHVLDGHNWFTLLTSLFVHADWTHLIGNMWFLLLFGDNLEDMLGRYKFTCFYLLVGALSVLFYVLTTLGSVSLGVPLIGSSGAISGLLGAYLIVYPRNRITLWMFFINVRTFSLSAKTYILLWFVFQLFYFYFNSSRIAYGAHIGGFFAGVFLIHLFKGNTTRKDFRVTGETVFEESVY